MRLGIALVAALPLLACNGDGIDGCPNEESIFELGTGTDPAWSLLNDGDNGIIVAGGQGGFHVDAAGRVGPFTQEALLVGTINVPGVAEPEVARVSTSRALANYQDDTCTGEFWGLQVVFNTTEPQRICNLNGRDADLQVTVETADGTITLSETRTLTMRYQECR